MPSDILDRVTPEGEITAEVHKTMMGGVLGGVVTANLLDGFTPADFITVMLIYALGLVYFRFVDAYLDPDSDDSADP